MFVCDKNWSCIGCNYQYADRLDQIGEEFRDCDKLIEVQEVKHASWDVVEEGWDNTLYTCSACGESCLMLDMTPADNLWDYCPNCGAKMDLQ